MIDVKKLKEDGFEILVIIGEVDASSSIELDNAMKEAVVDGNKNLLIDCSKLEYISSAGLGVFMSYLDEIKRKNITLIFFGLNDKVLNVFKILGLDQLLHIEKDYESAKAALNEV
ncbi:MAG: STAS domain-containing protein [Candidatus Cyclobacteriaceae bacterium M2_1C_046]